MDPERQSLLDQVYEEYPQKGKVNLFRCVFSVSLDRQGKSIQLCEAFPQKDRVNLFRCEKFPQKIRVNLFRRVKRKVNIFSCVNHFLKKPGLIYSGV